jgi:Ca-activated chloride channel family protein
MCRSTLFLAGLTLASLFVAPSVRAQYDDTDYLYVLDPQTSWWTQQGTIEAATVTMKPHGIYTEVGLYLTFSARDAGFTEETLVEVVLGFGLPEEAVVTDSWLWVGDDIVRADLIDRWTASQIYEDIVRRRRDPSILAKIAPGRYELRVFPMPGTGTRKVKITYLVPADWAAASVATALPTRLLETSLYPIETFEVQAWTDPTWSRAWLLERPDPAPLVHNASNRVGIPPMPTSPPTPGKAPSTSPTPPP